MKRLFFLLILCVVTPCGIQAQPFPQPNTNSQAISVSSVDFQLIGAQAHIGKREYVLSANISPIIYPLGDNFYRLEFEIERNSRSSFRGNERVHIHFFYDGLRLTFFGDRNGNERPDRHEKRQEHLIRHKQELITEGNRRFMRSTDLFIDLERNHITAPTNLRYLKLHFIFR